MKAIILTLILSAFTSVKVSASEINYQCIADTLQAYNSSIYYDVSPTDIDTMLNIPEMAGHLDTLNAKKKCDAEAAHKIACFGEAQVIGKVKAVKKTYNSCRVFLSENSSIQLSGVCPLDEGKLFSEGVEVGFLDGHDCRFSVGDTISGILVDNGYQIILE